MVQGAAAVAPAREAWADLAKAGCIVMVVAFHVDYYTLRPVSDGLGTDTWSLISGVFRPVRMPLFFTVSGYFAARALSRSWREVLRPRVTNVYYVYVVWLLIQAVCFVLLPRTGFRDSWKDLPVSLLVGTSWLWYLYALALYFAVAKLCRAHWQVVLAAGATLSVVAFGHAWPLPGDRNLGTAIVRNFLFYAVGAYLPQLVDRMRRTATLRRAVVVAGLVAALAGAQARLLPAAFEVFDAGICGLGVYAGVAITELASRNRHSAAIGGWLGARTLPIYVLHPIFVVALSAWVTDIPQPLVLAYGVVVTSLVVTACVLLHAAAERLAPWLFALPRQPRHARRRQPRSGTWSLSRRSGGRGRDGVSVPVQVDASPEHPAGLAGDRSPGPVTSRASPGSAGSGRSGTDPTVATAAPAPP